MRIKQKPIILLFFFILATIPLLFGARHPLVQGAYTSLILFTCGTWLVLNFEKIKPSVFNKGHLAIYVLILYIFLTSLPLPTALVQILSPFRADSLADAVNLAKLNGAVTSLSYYAPGTRFYSVYLLGLLLYYLCAKNVLRRSTDIRVILWIILFVGLFESVYGLLQAIVSNMGILWLTSDVSAEGSARGTIIYRNQFAALLNMCWPMAVVLGTILYHPVISRFNALKKREKTVSVIDRLSLVFQKAAFPFWAAAFMILAVIFSQSRGGIIVMLLLVAFFLATLPFSRRVKALAAGSLLLFIILYGGMIGFQNVTDRFLAFYQGAQGRFLLWLDSLAILQDHLLTGTGMGTYKFLSPLYLTNVSNTLWFDFAHNEYLELTIELGLPAAALFFAWLAWHMLRAGAKVVKGGRKIETFTFYPENLIIAIGSFCAILGLLLHGFVDFVWRLPANALYAVTLLAMLRAALASGQIDAKR